MDYSAKALSVFRQEYQGMRMNCAQAVCHAAGRDDLIEAMSCCGGGKVEGGTCGALHAAAVIAGDGGEQIMQQFADRNHDTTCVELKRAHKVSCQECVSSASQLLEEYEAQRG